MSRVARAIGVAVAAFVIVLAPWAGAVRARHDASFFVDDDAPLLTPPAPAPALAAPVPLPFVAQPAAGGCGCDTVVIDASNDVTDAEVRTGNAKAVNRQVTYISAAYAAKYQHDIEVDVRQVARAVSGDAMAGQSIALAAPGPRCHNILVRARNVLQDVEVRSGNATAINHSTILVDPGVDPTSLDIRLRQHALARSGSASAGQFIGVSGATRSGCGGVTVDASNLEDNVDVRSGRARGINDNKVEVCAEAGCAAELRALAPRAADVQMCTSDGCSTRSGGEVLSALPPKPSPSPAVTPTAIPSEDPASSPVPSASPAPGHGPAGKRRPPWPLRSHVDAPASPSPTPEAAPTPDAGDSPSPASTDGP